MTTLEKLNFIREERYQDLNDWQKDFIEDRYEAVTNHPDEITDDEVKEFFTRKQIEKIDEIWEELGL